MKLELHPEAELELVQAASRYEGEVPGLGRRFAGEVEHSTQLLIEHPLLRARIV